MYSKHITFYPIDHTLYCQVVPVFLSICIILQGLLDLRYGNYIHKQFKKTNEDLDIPDTIEYERQTGTIEKNYWVTVS